jgi:transposase-like protein
VSNLNQKVYGKIEEWRNRPLTGEYPYVFVDGNVYFLSQIPLRG